MGLGFYIGDRLIPYYGFFIALGVVAAGAVGCLQVKLFRKDCNDFFILAGMVGTGGDNRREASVSGGILGTDRCFFADGSGNSFRHFKRRLCILRGCGGRTAGCRGLQKMAPGGYLGLRRGLHSLHPYRPCLWTVRLQRCGMLLRDAL